MSSVQILIGDGSSGLTAHCFQSSKKRLTLFAAAPVEQYTSKQHLKVISKASLLRGAPLSDQN